MYVTRPGHPVDLRISFKTSPFNRYRDEISLLFETHCSLNCLIALQKVEQRVIESANRVCKNQKILV